MRNRVTFVGSRFIPENKNLERRALGCVFFETKTDETPEPGSRGGHSYKENARILGDLVGNSMMGRTSQKVRDMVKLCSTATFPVLDIQVYC